MGCCCCCKKKLMIELELPSREVLKIPAPSNFSSLEKIVRSRFPEADEVRFHHLEGTLSAKNYPMFLTNPNRYVVEVSTRAKRSSPKFKQEKTIEIEYEERPERFLIDVKKGEIALFQTQSMGSKIFNSGLIQKESRVTLLDDRLIITGGRGDSRACFELILDTGKLWKLPQMLNGRESHAIAVLGESVYVIGGYAGQELTSCEVYSNQEWFPASMLIRPRSFHCALSFRDWVYVFGGLHEKTIEVFENSLWRLLSIRFPDTLSRVGVCPLSYRSILICGGEIGGEMYNSSAWALDIEEEALESFPPPPEPVCFSHCGTTMSNTVLLFNWDSLFQFKSSSWTIQRMII